jgi:2-polyprenyl-3-methyl-5-hydroxy-6-metoxy-1,4-benzoquinol methylase
MRVVDVGCGMGYFSIPLARMVGEAGYVQAVDLQSQRLVRVEKRARKAGVLSRIELTLATQGSLNLNSPMDFILALAVVHEVPSVQALFAKVFKGLRTGGRMFIAEPTIHVRQRALDYGHTQIRALKGPAESIQAATRPTSCEGSSLA